MRFPRLEPNSKGRIGFSRLSGGINLRDSLSQSSNDQLTELFNMWYKNGFLRTRPGIQNSGKAAFFEDKPLEFDRTASQSRIHSGISYGGKRLISYKIEYFKGEETEERIRVCIYFFLVGENECLPLAPIVLEEDKDESFFVAEKDGILYCFLQSGKVKKIELNNRSGEWKDVAENEFHTPLVAINCKSNGRMVCDSKKALETGKRAEGINIIGDYYKISYNAYNPQVDDNNFGHIMSYTLLDNLNKDEYKGMTVKAEYTDQNGNTHHHSVTLENFQNFKVAEKEPSTDGLVMQIYCQMVYFMRYEDVEGVQTLRMAYINSDVPLENNLVITAPYKASAQTKEKIFGMTRGEWFGGGSEGLGGGTRLFLCGNQKHKSLVYRSGLDNPLYFPENAYFYVGDTSQAVTGFGKQSDSLVIFKENETWYTYYAQSSESSFDTASEYYLSDYINGAVYFPLVLVNSEIGCKYPDTVQLCRNRLVWAGDSGNVYTLADRNQYNERCIFPLSEMISSKLKSEDLKNAVSCDFGGYYVLAIENRLYVMDYNSYGYINVGRYNKNEDSNLKIPWYYWELPQIERGGYNSQSLYSYGGGMAYINFSKEQNQLVLSICSFEEEKYEDLNLPIKSFITTKLFDFGRPEALKRITNVGLSLGACGKPITVTFIAGGDSSKTAILPDKVHSERNPDFIKSIVIAPNAPLTARFGVKLECDGGIVIEGITINYTIKGRAK